MIKKYTNIVGRIETRFIFFLPNLFLSVDGAIFSWQSEFDLQILQSKAAAKDEMKKQTKNLVQKI